MRLLAFERVELGPGEIRTITLKAEPKLLAKFDAIENKWRIISGTHKIAIRRSADDLVLRSEVKLPAQLFGR